MVIFFGDKIRIIHFQSKNTLRSHLRFYTSGSCQQEVICGNDYSLDDLFQVITPPGIALKD